MGIVVVTGAPGSGKSTVAGPLATELGWSLVEKDVIKEALGDALDEIDRDEQRRLSAAAFLVIDALAPRLRDTVIEGNVYPGSPLATRLRARPDAVEVHCSCPLPMCRDRFVERGRSGARHRVHSGGDPSLAYLGQFAEPIGLARVVQVDTTVHIDVGALAATIRHLDLDLDLDLDLPG